MYGFFEATQSGWCPNCNDYFYKGDLVGMSEDLVHCTSCCDTYETSDYGQKIS